MEDSIMEWFWYIIAAVGALTELFTPGEYDTI